MPLPALRECVVNVGVCEFSPLMERVSFKSAPSTPVRPGRPPRFVPDTRRRHQRRRHRTRGILAVEVRIAVQQSSCAGRTRSQAHPVCPRPLASMNWRSAICRVPAGRVRRGLRCGRGRWGSLLFGRAQVARPGGVDGPVAVVVVTSATPVASPSLPSLHETRIMLAPQRGRPGVPRLTGEATPDY